MLKTNKKEIISLVRTDFTPLEESKEGYLKGGFGAIITQSAGPAPFSLDNCRCNNDRNNCHCPDSGCIVGNASCRPSQKGNNCKCGTTTTIPPTPTPPANTPLNSLTDGGMFF